MTAPNSISTATEALATQLEAYAARYSGDWSNACPTVTWAQLDLIVAALRGAAQAAPQPHLQGVIQQAIMAHPWFEGGPSLAYGFAGAALKAMPQSVDPAYTSRNDIGILLSALRQFEEAVGETFDDEGGDIAAIERDYKASSMPSTEGK